MARRTTNIQERNSGCICCCLPCIVCFMSIEKILQTFCERTLWVCVKTQQCFEFVANKLICKKKKIKIKNEEK